MTNEIPKYWDCTRSLIVAILQQKKIIMRKLLIIVLISTFYSSKAQNDNLNFFMPDTENRLKQIGSSSLKIGGYGQVDYNQMLDKNNKTAGLLDVHRIILFFGYEFSPKWELTTEIEFEHVKEVYIEQAYLAYKHNKYLNFKGGLILIPMGYVNEYHEPLSFFGVERPLIDTKVVPTTWREIGFGMYGRIPELSMKYQLYLVNGFTGFTTSAKFDGEDAFRGGRQKGAESRISYPNLSSKIELYGIKNLKLGISGYFGKSQSSLLNSISKTNEIANLIADSSVISTSMIGLDATYQLKDLQVRGQMIYAFNKNVEAYNLFGNTDLGNEIYGYYLEMAYNISRNWNKNARLMPFIRYENFDTQYRVSGQTGKNEKYHRKAFFAGISYFPTNGVVLKADFQWVYTNFDNSTSKGINLGVGYMF